MNVWKFLILIAAVTARLPADPPEVTPMARLQLKAVEVFDLQPETRRLALRGIIGAGNEDNVVAGQNLAGLVKDAPMSDRHAMPAENFTDPWSYYLDTTFSEPVSHPFDFGNGVVKDLPLIRVMNRSARGRKNGLLLNLAYTGELELAGKIWRVEVVQGAGREYAERLAYPGFFDDPSVSVLLYDSATGARVPAMGRLKRIDGVWYSFVSSPDGGELTVNRIDGVGRITVDAGRMAQADFAFQGGYFETEDGLRLALDDLTFEDGAVVPAASYTFKDLRVRNGGKDYRLFWPSSEKSEQGQLTVPADGNAVLKLGQRAELNVRNTSGLEEHGLFDLEKFSFDLVDLDLGCRVVPSSKEPFRVTSYRNSAGDELPIRFKGKLCGWTGEVIQLGVNRVSKKGRMVVTPDPNPPASVDTRTITVTADFAGLYGTHTGEMKIRVRNDRFRLQGAFYTLTADQEGFPDFAALRPEVVLPEAHMSAVPTLEPWTGLPPEMADHFGAVYTCRFYPSDMGKGISHYTFEISCQGAARVFVDDEMVLAHTSPDQLSRKVADTPLTLKAGAAHLIRIEYIHGTGPAALTVSAKVKTEPYYQGVLELDPDKPGFDGINDAAVEETAASEN